MVTSFILDTKGANVAMKRVRRVIMDGAMIAAPSCNKPYYLRKSECDVCMYVPDAPKRLALFDLRWLSTV